MTRFDSRDAGTASILRQCAGRAADRSTVLRQCLAGLWATAVLILIEPPGKCHDVLTLP